MDCTFIPEISVDTAAHEESDLRGKDLLTRGKDWKKGKEGGSWEKGKELGKGKGGRELNEI